MYLNKSIEYWGKRQTVPILNLQKSTSAWSLWVKLLNSSQYLFKISVTKDIILQQINCRDYWGCKSKFQKLAAGISTDAKEAFEEARAGASAAASSSSNRIKQPNQMSRENSSNISFMFAGLICEGSHKRLSILLCCSAFSGCSKDKQT